MKQPKPRFKHDCDTCIFLGRFKRYDLYIHIEEPKTVIARYGSDGPEYVSGMNFTSQNVALRTAYDRAKKRRLL